MTDKETVVVDSDDDINIGLVISDVKSLADEEHLVNQTSSDKPKLPMVQLPLENDSTTFVSEFKSCLPQDQSPSPLPLHLRENYKESTSLSGDSEDCTELSSDIIPDIQQCLSSWRTVFPWVQYKKSNRLICEVCQWGFDFPKYHEVLQFYNKSEKFSVAAKLKAHSRKKFHCIAEEEQALTWKLSEEFYLFVKCKMYKNRNIDSFLQGISLFSTNQIPIDFGIVSHVVQNFAAVIEEKHMRSLCASPYFSIIAFGSVKFLILRWLTPQNEVVERGFCSYIQRNKQKLSILAYLQYRGLDMSRMVSFSDLLEPPKKFIRKTIKAVNVSNRLCPVDILLTWLSRAELLQDILLHLEAIIKICKIPGFPKRLARLRVMANYTPAEAYKALKIEGFLYSIVLNSVALNVFVHKFSSIHGFQGIDFEKLSRKRNSPLFEMLYLVPKLNYIVEDVDSPDCLKNLKILQNIITSKAAKIKEMKGLHNENEDKSCDLQADVIITVMDMFVSQAILTKDSQDLTAFPYIDILSREMRSITDSEYEDVFSVFMPSLINGKGLEQLKQLRCLSRKGKHDTPLKILGMLQCCPEYHQRFEDLLRLGQIIMVIPTLNAHEERYPFEITLAEYFISGRIPKELVPLLMFIYLEGPPSLNCLSREKILKVFEE
ncbi:uncharacterized protein [Palaemon carinicauda]|uniref:uncharacterized protein n=1 Tax=Palaemon carinicauda TaxID=392227 RepID=UPI0035B5F115